MVGIDSFTTLMLHMNGDDGSTSFIDSSLYALSVTPKGSAQIDTAQSVFGGASGLFSNYTDYLTIPANSLLVPGSNNFTIDFRVKRQADTTSYVIYFYQNASGSFPGTSDPTNGWYLYRNNNRLYFRWRDSGVTKVDVYTTNALDFGTDFQHIAVVRNGTDLRIYFNGVSQALTVNTAISTNALNSTGVAALQIGRLPGYSFTLNGWLDELRFSNGSARWTADFTPPIDEYTPPLPIQLTPSLEWLAIQERVLTPSLEWSAFSRQKFVPNIVNYPVYYDIPAIRSSKINVGFSGCLAGYSISLKNTGSSGNTVISLYAKDTLIETKTIPANNTEFNYLQHTDLSLLLIPNNKLEIRINEVAQDAEELRIFFYEMTFPFNLEINYWGNIQNDADFFGLKNEYLFGFADNWFIELNQPIMSVDYLKIIDSNGQEISLDTSLETGNFYNNRIKFLPYTDSIIDHIKIRVQDLFNKYHVLEFKPIYSLFSSDFPENFAKSIDAITESETDSTGSGVAYATENNGTADKAVDNIANNTSYWVSNTHLNDVAGLPQSWAYDFGLGNSKRITRLNLKPYTDANGLYIRNFQIWGSNLASPDLSDDADWTAIYGGNCADILGFQSFTFSNLNSYRWYRIKIVSNYRSDPYTELGYFNAGIDELELFESSVSDKTSLIINNWLSAKYYRYSFDNGETFTNFLNIDDFQRLTIDFTDKLTGTYQMVVQYLVGEDIIEDSFSIFYVAEELSANVQFLGETARINYSDSTPFNRVETYYDNTLDKIETPNIFYGFTDVTLDQALKKIIVDSGNFYYQNKVYSWDGSDYIVQPDFDLGTVSFTVLFGFNTQTLEFEFIEDINSTPNLDREIIITDFIVLKRIDYTASPTATDYSTYNIKFGASFSYIPEALIFIDLSTQKNIEIRIYDIVGRYVSFFWNQIKTQYNIWRTLTVTPNGGGDEILPGEIHQNELLDYKIESET